MARYHDEDEFDYKNIRPGEIDKDLFETDDDDYEIEESDVEESEDEEWENYSDYEVASEDSETESIKDIVEEDSTSSENTKFDAEEEMEMDEEETSEEIEKPRDDPVEETTTEEPEIAEPDEEKDSNEVVETPTIEENDHSNEETTKEESIKDIIETKEEETPVEEKKDDLSYIDNAIVKNPNDSDDDIRCRGDLVNLFKKLVDTYFKRYKENDIIAYLDEFIDIDDNRKFFSETFIMQYCKFSLGIDFKNSPDALKSLWVVVAGMFADKIEEQKRMDIIPSVVVNETDKAPTDVNIIEDERLRTTRDYQRAQDDKFSKYRLDRTIFKISDDTDENNCSIFDDKRTLDKDFYESVFYKIHKEIMTSDRSADMSKIFASVLINENTSYIPIIDYSTGIRVVCIDTNDTDQYRLNPLLISRKVPFSFNGFNNRNIKVRILYLDDAVNRPVAIISSLKKLIAYKYFKDKYKIRLNRNYVIAYTTEPRWVEKFEKGDTDSHKPENSTYSMSKPSNMTFGVIVLDKKTTNDKRAIRRNQISRDVGVYETPTADDYNVQFVISARVSKNDLRLRNPAIPKNERYVEYIITQYNECNPVIILDGFQTIIACIIKEHKNTYSPGTPYAISYEYDRDAIVSPSVVAMLDERDGLEPALNQRNNPVEIDASFIMPPSRRKMEGVFDFECGRLDKRYFSPASIQRKYDRSLWANYDLATKDGRIQFIKSRGFEEFLHNKPIVFDVMPYALSMIESSDMIRDIVKVSITMLADRNSADTEAILFKQTELNYRKSLGDSKAGTFHLFLFEAANFIIDSLANKNK